MKSATPLAAFALIAGAAAAAPAQQPAPKITGSAALRARAKVTGDSATKVARAQVPNGRVQSGELEEEKGKLIYSFDIKVAGKSGIEEVQVDALTGAVVSHEHETPAMEKKEAAADAKEKAAAKKKP